MARIHRAAKIFALLLRCAAIRRGRDGGLELRIWLFESPEAMRNAMPKDVFPRCLLRSAGYFGYETEDIVDAWYREQVTREMPNVQG